MVIISSHGMGEMSSIVEAKKPHRSIGINSHEKSKIDREPPHNYTGFLENRYIKNY